MIFIQKHWKYDPNFEQVKNLKNMDTKFAASETFYVLPFLVLEIFSIYYNIYLAVFLTLSKKAITLKFCLRLVRVFKSIFWKFGSFSVVRSSHKLRSNLAVFLTSNILTPFLVKTPIFWEMLLGSTQSATQTLDAIAVVVQEISCHKLMPNLAVFLTLSMSTPFQLRLQTLGKRC